MNTALKTAIEAAILAGKEIMRVYAKDIETSLKEDNSPITMADRDANAVITKLLGQTPYPVISEESKQLPYEVRKQWDSCWIVDPLDGTKEFIKKNDEFTVNIALVKQGLPVLGVIFIPALDVLYYAVVSEKRAYKVQIPKSNHSTETLLENAKPIAPFVHPSELRIVESRSHFNAKTSDVMEFLKKTSPKPVSITSKGSSLKFCLIAEGTADAYLRFSPTMEWDTAAGHAICKAIGVQVIDLAIGNEMEYNKENLLNNDFLVTNQEIMVSAKVLR